MNIRKTLMSAAIVLCGTLTALAAPTTLKWTGGGGDFKLATAANWTGDTGKFSDASNGVVLDLTDVASGVVLTNNFSAANSCCLAGVTLPANRTIGLYGDEIVSGKTSLRFLSGCVLTVPTGSVLNFNLYMANTWGDPNTAFKVTGGGELKFLSSGMFLPYDRTLEVDANTTFTYASPLAGTSGLCMTVLKLLDSSSRLVLESDMEVESVQFADGAFPEIKLNGHTLKSVAGEKGRAGSFGNLVGGNGSVAFDGGLLSSIMTPFTALSSIALGNCGLTVLAGTSAGTGTPDVSVFGGGYASFTDSQTVGALTGVSADGVVAIGQNATLTLAGNGADSTYKGVISGAGSLKKTATFNQTLCGRGSYTGATTVEGGTLTVDSGTPVHGGETLHIACENESNLFYDTAPTHTTWNKAVPSKDSETNKQYTALNPISLGDGISGRAMYVGQDLHTYWWMNGNASALAPLHGGKPFTFSFWMRLDPDNDYYCNMKYVFDGGTWASYQHFWVFLQNTGNIGFSCMNNWGSVRNLTDDGTYLRSDLPEGYLSDGQWHQIVLTYADQVVKLHVDATNNYSMTLDSPLNIASASGNYFQIGYKAECRYCPNADLDEIIISDHVWSADEIVADYNRVAQDRSVLLPTPVAHWDFNTAANLGRDSGPNGYNLVNGNQWAPSSKTDSHCYGSAMRGLMKLETYPAKFPVGAKPFSVSVRYRTTSVSEKSALFGWGDPNTSYGMIQLAFFKCPRQAALSWSKVDAGDMLIDGLYCANVDTDGGWCHLTITYDPTSKVLNCYRDGALVGTKSNLSLSIGNKNFYVGGRADGAGTVTANVDDMQVFDVVLTQEQVELLSRSLETGKCGPVLPSASPITVSTGAKLAVKGDVHTFKSLSGGGTVELANGAAFTLSSGDAFAGKVTGDGTVRLQPGASLASASKVSADVRIEENAVIDGDALPVVSTDGDVYLPSVGTIKFTAKPKSLIVSVAKGQKIHAPLDFSGWAVEGLGGREYVLRVVDGEFQVKTKGGLFIVVK